MDKIIRELEKMQLTSEERLQTKFSKRAAVITDFFQRAQTAVDNELVHMQAELYDDLQTASENGIRRAVESMQGELTKEIKLALRATIESELREKLATEHRDELAAKDLDHRDKIKRMRAQNKERMQKMSNENKGKLAKKQCANDEQLKQMREANKRRLENMQTKEREASDQRAKSLHEEILMLQVGKDAEISELKRLHEIAEVTTTNSVEFNRRVDDIKSSYEEEKAALIAQHEEDAKKNKAEIKSSCKAEKAALAKQHDAEIKKHKEDAEKATAEAFKCKSVAQAIRKLLDSQKLEHNQAFKEMESKVNAKMMREISANTADLRSQFQKSLQDNMAAHEAKLNAQFKQKFEDGIAAYEKMQAEG